MSRGRIIGLAILLAGALLGQWSVHWPPARLGESGGPADRAAAGAAGQRIEFLMGRTMDLNLASATDLAALPGIGPGLARKIIAFRQKIGSFTKVDQLTDVKGVGPVTAARINPFLSVAQN